MTTSKNNIIIDLSKDSLFPQISLTTLRDRYFIKGETSPQHAFARVCAAFADDDAHAQRLYDAVSKHWFMFSTPILANGGTGKNLGISCFLQHVEDSIEGITEHYTESTYLTVNGGGLGGYWPLRTSGKGSKSNGMIPFMKVMDSLMLASNQAGTRRGAYAAYLDISHPEIEEFVEIRDPSGDHSRRCLGMGFHHSVVIPDKFMEAVKSGGDWDLIDPHTKEVTKTIKARTLWKSIMLQRRKTGEPYLMFSDTANEFLSPHLRKKGLKIHQSNLCNEIYLPTGVDYNGKNRTAICCLSSLNAATFDQWKPHATQLIEDIMRMLDNVITHFIENAPPQAHQATYSASMTRDVGIGMMGFHHYLQTKNIAFESKAASTINNEIFYTYWKAGTAATRKLGEEKGYYPDAYDFDGKLVHKARNAHWSALAPNASSGIICGNTSPQCELYHANAYKHTTASGSFLSKNPALEALLETKGLNNSETWNSIIAYEGSVQQIEGLTDHEKLVFKTSFETDQMWVVEHYALRQAYIDQGQSLNLYFSDTAKPKYIHDVHMSIFDKKLKGSYYLRSQAQKSGEKLSIVKTRETVNPEQVSCEACEG